ncbi:integrase catalytic domain-containing protein [Trichonephila clavipes]|nr:integrase catalytic domain-containing protein [Trichonephila clavipes]
MYSDPVNELYLTFVLPVLAEFERINLLFQSNYAEHCKLVTELEGRCQRILSFWSQFSKIHEDPDIVPEDKFQYLAQCIIPNSRAAHLINSFPMTDDNYPKAIEQLKERFGRDSLLVQIFVRDLLNLVMKNAVPGRSNTDLAVLYDSLESKLRALESLGRTKEKFADLLGPLVESCLPGNVLRAWERSRNSEDAVSKSNRTLENLMTFLRHEVESEEISLARSGFSNNYVKRNKTVVTSDVPTAALLVSTSKGNEIDLLIGADVIGKILCGRDCVELTSGLTAIKTNLGWTVIRKPNETLNDSYCKDNVLVVLSLRVSNNSLRELWNLEVLGDTSVWGILWNLDNDLLRCNIKLDVLSCDSKITKRLILSIVNSIFDPIGILKPAMLVPKIMLQESWRLKIPWDEVLPSDIQNEFCKWESSMLLLKNVSLPRYVEINASSELHVFVDASKGAYAACIFVRTVSSSEVKLNLMRAKCRVAPLKQLSTPRLELMACCIGSRLALSVRNALDIADIKTVFGSDSTVVLWWIIKDDEWSIFVTNRVKEIRQFSHVQSWRHVPGNMNPADVLSRGCSQKKMLESQW